MPSPRIRRLTLDYQLLREALEGAPLIAISGAAGLPPEIYRFTYKVKGLYVSPSGEILERDTHVLEVNLTLDYPRRAPQCRMLTPVFHPNFDEVSVCIGDFWAASEGLDDLIVRIGRMIAFQEYNTKSPLNGLAAKWAAEHGHLLPIDDRVISTMKGLSPDSAPPLSYPEGVSPAELPVSGTSAAQLPADQAQFGRMDPWSDKIIIR